MQWPRMWTRGDTAKPPYEPFRRTGNSSAGKALVAPHHPLSTVEPIRVRIIILGSISVEHAAVAELADAPALGAGGATRGGSSPSGRTCLRRSLVHSVRPVGVELRTAHAMLAPLA